jgi:23S rRNA pseudouridine1911/1915/1917 synthase
VKGKEKNKVEPEIIFEDDSLVVINKPPGMVVNTSQTAREETVQEWFINKYQITNSQNSEFGQKGGVVHRLDKETSGLLVLARIPSAYEKLKLQFLERKTVKKYKALVHGIMNPEKGIISLPVVRHPRVWGKFTIGKDLSRTAVTEWKREVIYEKRNGYEKYSLLDLMPMTGRTHQIRVHLKHLGHPIVSDPLYAGVKVLKADTSLCPRLFLHAYSLQLVHPITGEGMIWEIDLPADLKQTLQKLVH